MNATEFLKTIYVGDQACKAIVWDTLGSEFKLQATCISRVRSATWNYYTEEDLPDGFIVFTGVDRVAFEPAGFVPNDLINDIRAEPAPGGGSKSLFVISVDSVDSAGDRTEVLIHVRAEAIELEDARAPGQRIRE